MILNLTNQNKEMVCKAIAEGLSHAHYNSDCYSLGDIRRYRDLTDDVSAIITKISFYGVNLYKELKEAFTNAGAEFDGAFLKKEFKKISKEKTSYDIKINSHSIWRVLQDKDLKSLFTKGSVEPVETDFYTLYDSEEMFVPIIKLNLDKEGAIDYLLNNDSVFCEAYNILKSELKGFSIKEVICIKEQESDEIGSEIRITYSNNNDIIYAIVNEDGTKSDILLVKNNIAYEIIPLSYNIFKTKKSTRRVLLEHEILECFNIKAEYSKKLNEFYDIENTVVDNLNLTDSEKYAFRFSNYGDYDFEFIEEFWSVNNDNEEYLDTDLSMLTENEFNSLMNIKNKHNDEIKKRKIEFIGKNLIEKYEKAVAKLGDNVVPLPFDENKMLNRIVYKDIESLINGFDKLIER